MALPAIVVAAASSAGTTLVQPIMRIGNFTANKLLPVEIPSTDDIFVSYIHGYVSAANAHKFIRQWGVDIPVLSVSLYEQTARPNRDQPARLNDAFWQRSCGIWESSFRSKLYCPSIDEANQLWQKKLISNRLHEFFIRRQTDNSPSMYTVWKDASYEIPGPQDLIRFAVREAYNPELITQFGYNKEVPLEVMPWMEKQGYGGKTNIQIPPGGTDGNDRPRQGDATWFDLYWWSHWELPSLTQGYDMLHKLYANSIKGPSPLADVNTFFSGPDLEKLQKAQDIPDYWRKRLQAISYNPIDKADAQSLFNEGYLDDAQLYHIIRQHGHNEWDTLMLVELAKISRQRNLGIQPSKEGVKYICEYYKLGVMSDDEADAMLRALGYRNNEPQDFLRQCLLELQGEQVKQTIKLIEQAYYRGIYSYEEVRIEMVRQGINQRIVVYMTDRWRYRREVRFKGASAKQNLTAYQNGVLSEANLVTRLFNLGYDGNSINVMVQNTKVKILQSQTQSLLKAAKDQAKQAKLAAEARAKAEKRLAKKAQDDAKIVTNKAQKRLRNFIKTSSDKNIKDWVKDNLIQVWEAFYRLFYKGYSLKSAMAWMQHNFKDITSEELDGSAKKASSQFRAEGNYLE